MEYSAQVVRRAMELWRYPDASSGRHLSFAQVSAQLYAEMNITVGKSTIQEWQKAQKWEKSSLPQIVEGGEHAAEPRGLKLPPRVSEEDWDWEVKKRKFLMKLCGIAEDCFTVVRQAGDMQLQFKDADSALKAGFAAVELIGKINSGKFEEAEAGDKIPAMSAAQVGQLIEYFVNKGPAPKFLSEAPTLETVMEETNAD